MVARQASAPPPGRFTGERGRDDLQHVPAFCERITKLLLRNAAGAHVPRLAIAEAEQVEHASGLQHRGQTGDVRRPLTILEDVEHAAIERRLEPSAELIEREGVRDEELGRRASLEALGPGLLDRPRRGVDADHEQPTGRQFERVLSGAAMHSITAPLNPPASAILRTSGCAFPMSHGGSPTYVSSNPRWSGTFAIQVILPSCSGSRWASRRPRLRTVIQCQVCGHDNPESNRFCGECAAPLDAVAVPSSDVRKTVTIVFCDLVGSTAMGEGLDPEQLRLVTQRYFDAMRVPIERHGGTVEKFIGDAVMAVFGVPQVHEDDAVRAVRAAADMREVLAALNTELDREHGVRLACRIGVNTGGVVAGQGDAVIVGDAVNVAARLEQAAAPSEISSERRRTASCATP